jgi:predicted dehydrogenase
MLDRRLRLGVLGAGHFGRFHTQKAATGARSTLIGLYDANPERAAQVAAEFGAPALSLDEVLDRAEAVVVAAPADAHHALAARALSAGKHVLVEKPIAATLEQADDLGALAERHKLVLQVGHLERFSAAYRAVAAHGVRPLYIEATRIAPFKPRGTDVSVILDLMIHDLDLVLALVDSELESVDAVGAPVASPFEDIANARLRFVNGCVATITASRISTRTERRMRIFGHYNYLTVDFAAKKLVSVHPGEGQSLVGVPGFTMRESVWQDHDSLVAEHEAFAASVLDGTPVLVDAGAGRRALAAALAITEAMAESRDRLRRSGLIA